MYFYSQKWKNKYDRKNLIYIVYRAHYKVEYIVVFLLL